MDVAVVRAFSVGFNFWAHGVPVTVTTPEAERPVSTRAIWMTTETEDVPGGLIGSRREPMRVMALQRSAVAEVPRGTLIVAPTRGGDVAQTWIVDGHLSQAHDHTQVIVLPHREGCDG